MPATVPPVGSSARTARKTGSAPKWSRLIGAALLSLLAAGCVQAPSSPESAPVQIGKVQTGGPAETETAALPPGTPMPDAPPVTIDMLMDADEAKLHRLLGLPQFRRTDPPARLLRYRAADCLLDLFLYPSKDGARNDAGTPRVIHIQARGRDGTDRPAPPCLDAIIEARQKERAG